MDKRKIVLLIDMDGPLCDWAGGLINAYNQYVTLNASRDVESGSPVYPVNILSKESPECKSYDANFWACVQHRPQESFPEEGLGIKFLTRRTGFYEGLQPVIDAFEPMTDILKCRFIDAYICSSPETTANRIGCGDLPCFSEKAQWVNIMLGREWVDHLILTKNKNLVIGDYLIDDNPAIFNKPAPWKPLLYDEFYNKDLSGVERFSWNKWPELKARLKDEYDHG